MGFTNIRTNTYILDTTLQNMLNIKNYLLSKLNIRSSLSNIFEFSSFWRYYTYLLMSAMNFRSPSWVTTFSCSTLKLIPVTFTKKSVSIYKYTCSYIVENFNFNWQRLGSPRLFCNFSFLGFSQSCLFPLYYRLSLTTRTFLKPVNWFHTDYNILWCVEYCNNRLSIIWNSSWKWVTFKVVRWVVPAFL